MSKESKQRLMNWVETMQDGDCVRYQMGEIIITNYGGCEIDRFYVE